jgi:nitronate monooxygenase
MLTTRFTERFGVTHPILCGPMAGETDGRLAAAVSNAGGLGTFGAMHRRQDDAWVDAQIELIRTSTDRPFGVGFITPFIPTFQARWDATIDARVPVVALSFGDPEPWLARAHDAGARVVCQVQSVADARRALEAGADALAAQGNEAGGHTGTMGLLALLGAVLDLAGDTPVLAAGGVANGRTLAAVLAMGADGAWMGTRFLATTDAPDTGTPVRDEIVASDGSDTVFTHAYDIVEARAWPVGIGERVRANAFTARWIDREDELRLQREIVLEQLPQAGRFDPAESKVAFGQSAALVSRVATAADVVDEIVGDAESQLHTTAARYSR